MPCQQIDVILIDGIQNLSGIEHGLQVVDQRLGLGPCAHPVDEAVLARDKHAAGNFERDVWMQDGQVAGLIFGRRLG